ncbi:Os08g0298800 [Oryza sativa Japonica Group]|uniref:Os08g0298800 protein n=1 Tax=Oryza sativa subsp. japonica TaxID=39947 RepID=Q0J6L8_ORYSJ|nr:Os08g0298800 [Oryza sativa Japonica Group]|eukprot:NP_001061483.1 Os08g0298800 [Oryza sativa Japonica Group]
MERIQWEEDSRGVDSDCRAAPTSDGRHDFMRTPIWACKYFMESLSSLLSNGSSHMSISVLERPQLSFYSRLFSVHGVASPLLAQWTVYPSWAH